MSPILGQKVPRSPVVARTTYLNKVFASEDSDILIPNSNKPNIVVIPKKRRRADNNSESNYSSEQAPAPHVRHTPELKGTPQNVRDSR